MSHLKPKRIATLLFLLASLSFSACGPGRPSATATLLLTNGAVYTMDNDRSRAEAVAISGDKILFAGSRKKAERFKGSATRTIDLGGRMVLPAFQDSHVHLVSGGIELGQCNLNGLKTRDEVFLAIRGYAYWNKDMPWVTGGGWDLPIFPGANPSKRDLDKLVPDRPACLSAADGHSVWVNSRALKIAGITSRTPDPPAGRIERDPRTGEPTGTLRESAARLVTRHIPELKPEDYGQGLRRALALANRFGITSIIEANADQKILDAYAALARSGELTVRVLASLSVSPDKGPEQVGRLVKLRETYRGTNLKATAAKIFVDGVLESRTAALLEPYADRPGERGLPVIEPAVLETLALALDAAGFQIHLHAIGDRAVRMSLDALAAAEKANGRKDLRPHIAHLELIDPADIPRFKALGVAANVQALWAWPDPYITDLTEPIIGPERSGRLYPIGSLAKSGAFIVGGSDWSVSSMNPLEAVQVAVTRRDPEKPAGPAWISEEIVDLPTMLAAYTINGAFLNHEEAERGSIEPGKAADLIVLSANLFDIPASEIGKTRVLLTIFKGHEVFRDPTFLAR